jgi:hypothetical protein
MMRSKLAVLLYAAVVAALPACAFADVRETVHRSVSVGTSPLVQVANSVGSVTVRGWDKPVVDIVAEKRAHTADALKGVTIDVNTRGSDISIATVNKSGAGFWSGAGVRYTIMVPANTWVQVVNETGGVKIGGVRGNVMVRAQTGGVSADLGKVAGNRTIDMRVATGGIDVTIARDSDATVDMHATVGGVKSEFSGDRIGTGSARIHLITTTGGVALHAS